MPLTELIHFRGMISFTFFRNDMHNDGAIVILGGFDCLCKILEIMSIDRTDVFYAELFEKYAVDHEIFHAVLDPVGHIPEFRADLRETVDEVFDIMFNSVILILCVHLALNLINIYLYYYISHH